MTAHQALIPSYLAIRGNKLQDNIICILSGILGLSLLAQVAVPLPWTPVPITGQTFGVALTALLWGRSRGTGVVFGYLLLGAAGLPVFAAGRSGLVVGPTLGYLIGMCLAAFVMGGLADRGWTKKFWSTYLAAFFGSLVTFACGLFVLSFFVPSDKLVSAGLLPFVPGDIIKTFLASMIVYQSQKAWKKSGKAKI